MHVWRIHSRLQPTSPDRLFGTQPRLILCLPWLMYFSPRLLCARQGTCIHVVHVPPASHVHTAAHMGQSPYMR
jgi:hypothetical protein